MLLHFVGEAFGCRISDRIECQSGIIVLLRAEGKQGDGPVTFHPAQPSAPLDLSGKAEKSETVPSVSHTSSLKKKTEKGKSGELQNFVFISPLRGNSDFQISMRMTKAKALPGNPVNSSFLTNFSGCVRNPKSRKPCEFYSLESNNSLKCILKALLGLLCI